MRANQLKLKNLILLILQRYNNQYLTETKLQKLLYFCDFGNYAENGTPITGYVYRKNHFGPTIMDLPTVLKGMEKDGVIDIIKSKTSYGTDKKLFSIKSVVDGLDLTFSKEELYVIQSVNEAYQKLTPREISRLSHADAPYLIAGSQGDIIDYDAVVYREEIEENNCKEDPEAAVYFKSTSFKNLMDGVAKKFGVGSLHAVN